MKRSRIGHLLPWPSVGGTEQATRRIAEATAAGFDHVFYIPPGAQELENFLSSAGAIRTYHAPEPSLRHIAKYFADSRRLARQLRNDRIDLLHCADILGAYYAGLAGKLAGVKVLSHVRNRHVLSGRERLFLKPVDFFAFVSKDTWRHSAWVPARKGVVVYDGIQIESGDAVAARHSVIAELNLPQDAILIVMAARVAPQKDYPTLILAAQELTKKHPRARFIIAGDNQKSQANREHFAEIQPLLASSGMDKYFVFIGFRTDVRRFLQAADIFVLSTHVEGLPLVLLEAMSESKPVVATAVDGVSEIVLDQQTGLTYPHEDHAALARCLEALIGSPARATELARASQAFVREQFSSQHFAQSMNALYHRLLLRATPK